MNFSINLGLLNENTIKQLAGDPGTSTDLISYLAKNGSEEVKTVCSSNPSCPLETLLFLIDEGSKHLKWRRENDRFSINLSWGFTIMKRCSFNPNCDIETIMNVLEEVPEAISNPLIPESAIREFYTKESAKIYNSDLLAVLAANPNCPVDILIDLSTRTEAGKTSSWLECAVARNKKTPPEVLVKLSRHWEGKNCNHEDIRRSVAGNKNTPIPVLYSLIQSDSDDEWRISDRAEKTIREIKEGLTGEEFFQLERMHEILYMGKHFV
jgi:hypothetical protein